MQFSIRKLITVVMALVMTIFTVILTFTVTRFYIHSTFETLSKANTERLQLVSQKADALANGAQAVSQLLCADERIAGTLLSQELSLADSTSVSADIALLCSKYYNAFQQFGLSFDVLCYGENGFRYSTCGYTEEDFSRLTSSAWFSKWRAFGETEYSVTNFVPMPDRGRDSYCYAIVKNFYQVNKHYAGSIIVFVREEILSSIFSGLTQKDSVFFLLNPYSTVISSNDKARIGTSPEAVRDYLFVRRNTPYEIYTNNVDVRCFCVKYTSPVTGWTIFEQMPLATIMQPCYSVISLIVAMAFGLYLLSLVVIFTLSRSISHSIQTICRQMEVSADNHFTHLKINSSLKEIGSISASYNNLCDQIHRLLNDIREAEKQANDAKFNFLVAQINPHFLYNTLFSIKCTVAMNNSEHACEMLTLLISLLRNTVGTNDTDTTLLESTIVIQQYVQLQNLRYHDRINLRMKLPPELTEHSIPRFLIQPLVENVFFHAIAPTGGAVDLLIRFHADSKRLLVDICDTGVGFSPEDFQAILKRVPLGNTSHIGLRNIQDRIQLLYGKDYGLSLSSEPGFSTVITLSLPL